MSRQLDQVLSSLSHHAVPAEGVAQDIAELKNWYNGLAQQVDRLTPDGRCKALAFTKLEESLMWAVKGCVLPPEPTAVMD